MLKGKLRIQVTCNLEGKVSFVFRSLATGRMLVVKKTWRSRSRSRRVVEEDPDEAIPTSEFEQRGNINNTTPVSNQFAHQTRRALAREETLSTANLGLFNAGWIQDYVETCSKSFNLGLDLEDISCFTNDALGRFSDFEGQEINAALLKDIQEWFAASVAFGHQHAFRNQHTYQQEQNLRSEGNLETPFQEKRPPQEQLSSGFSTRLTNMAPSVTGTPVLGQFLVAIDGFVKVQNEQQLADYLPLEPPFGELYYQLIAELKQVYPKDNESALEEKCRQSLSAARDGVDGSATWTPFILFMVQYLSYIRDVTEDPSKLLETYDLLIGLQERANSALTHGTLGVLMLPIVVACAKLVCRLAIGLDRQPELMAQLRSAGAATSAGDDEGGARETLPERAAEILRRAFTACMNDKTTAADKVEGKKRGIYKIANICLKILFQCRKTRNAAMIFENIGNQSPQLSQYPQSERVTYLYYLGRYLFQNNHFYRAQEALQYAYNECSARDQFVRQRRHILVYLVTSNLILGRFPSAALLSRPEAVGFQDHFLPIMQAMRSGNLALFRQTLDFSGPHADWFLHFRILLPLKNRCEVYVWRTLVRRAWKYGGKRNVAGSSAAPLIEMQNIVAAFQLAEKATVPSLYVDPDFAGEDYEPTNGMGYEMMNIESILASLIDQGLAKGFIARSMEKFVLKGLKGISEDSAVLAACFPPPWSVISARARRPDGEVPGWRKRPQAGPGGGGRVVQMSNLATVGAA